MSAVIRHGDCLEVMRGMEPDSIDAIVTDPPYHLTSIVQRFGSNTAAPAKSNGATGVYARASRGFMGQAWDGGNVAFDPETWVLALRVLKPGGHLLAFGGARTYHRLACAVEDAGFEIRDQVMWFYGSGFPKSRDVSKAIDAEAGAGAEREIIGPSTRHSGRTNANNPISDLARYGTAGDFITAPATEAARQWQGWGTALKPAHEPIVLARKPLVGTVAENVQQFGTGALNIDECRIEGRERTEYGLANAIRSKVSTYGEPSSYADFDSRKGRWPANIIHDGSEEVEAAFAVFGEKGGGFGVRGQNALGIINDDGWKPSVEGQAVGFGDTGTASRFFYCAKAGKKDRDDGLEGKPKVKAKATNWSGEGMPLRQNGTERKEPLKCNTHPTVKPTTLMRYLCRLITPPGGTVLDPFAGSGSTGRGAVLEGFNFVGIEMDKHYADIAGLRINAAVNRVPAQGVLL